MLSNSSSSIIKCSRHRIIMFRSSARNWSMYQMIEGIHSHIDDRKYTAPEIYQYV
jgi:hypothetical protein